MSVPPAGGWQPPPPGWQPGWPQQPAPPPQKGNSLKWLLIAVAVLLVIGISVGATLLFTRGSGGGGSTTSTAASPSDIPSANDTGPVAIITDEPTCKTFLGINDNVGAVERNGWSDSRGTLATATDWTQEQRTQVEAVANSMQTASDQIAALAKQTPHRVMRELYEQFIAYGRAYVASIPTYVPINDNLASANVNISATLFGMCEAIESGSANRAASVTPLPSPSRIAKSGESAHPELFIKSSGQSCADWIESSDQFNSSTAEWQKLDPNNPDQWSPDQRAAQQAAMPFVSRWAKDMESIGRQSGTATFEDFGSAASAYLAGYTSAGESYVGADGWLRYVAYKINQTVQSACRAGAS